MVVINPHLLSHIFHRYAFYYQNKIIMVKQIVESILDLSFLATFAAKGISKATTSNVPNNMLVILLLVQTLTEHLQELQS